MREKVAELEVQVQELKDEIRREKQKALTYSLGLDAGTQIVAFKQGMMDAGLSECEAMKIIIEQIKHPIN